MTPLTIRPAVSIGVYPADNHLCSRETCRFTGTRHVCELFRMQLTPTDFFDEDGNRLLKRCGACNEAQACTVPPNTLRPTSDAERLVCATKAVIAMRELGNRIASAQKVEAAFPMPGYQQTPDSLRLAALASAQVRQAAENAKPHRNNLRSRKGK